MENQKRTNHWYFGGISSATTACITHPLDVIKVHLQTQQLPRESFIQIISRIYQVGGVIGFYRGLSASLMRQLTYTTTRFGLYEAGKQFIDVSNYGHVLMLAAFAGFCGGIVGVPADMINVRMQNDLKLPMEKRRKNVFDGLHRVIKEEGPTTLYQGGSASVMRGVMMTIGQNAVYDSFKGFLLNTTYFKDDVLTHSTSSIFSSGMGTLVTQPLDVIKTRLMNAKVGQYKGMMSVALEIAKTGPSGFLKGFMPAFMRLCPHTILTFLIMEQLRLHYGYIPEAGAAAS